MFVIENCTSLGASNMQLILEKIKIPTQRPYISRPRLLALLKESLSSCTSTIVNGRAGSGKTFLAADFARHCSRAVAWYKVDAPEGDLQVFFEYLIASIQRQRPDFGQSSLLRLLDTTDSNGTALLAEAFIFELLQGENKPLLIVIEDLHLICDSPWVVSFFRRLLPLLPSDVHMLITSRTLPPAPLWRMRSKQTLAVIDEACLAFTPGEAVELFETYGLSSEHARHAFELTHGRAAALVTQAGALNKSRTGHEKRSN